MGTRSVVAIPHGDAWRGRYVHWDGYPTHMARTLTELVRRDGLAKVTMTLTESFYGWSSINAAQVDESAEPDFDTDRFASVVGYGTAYTDQPDEWHTPDPEAWTEWAYVLTPSGLLVVKQGYKSPDRVLGLYDWNTDHDWSAVESAGYAEPVTA